MSVNEENSYEISRSISQLETQMHRLNNVLGALRKRLEPVMGKQSLVVHEEKKTEYHSPLAQQILASTIQIREYVEVCLNILDRLQV